MQQRERVAHWMRRNEASRLPRRMITLDSESTTAFSGKIQRQTFRLGSLCLDALDADGAPLTDGERLTTLDAGELWAACDAFTSTRHRTYLFAHNLSFDLRLTSGLEHLPRLGWDIRSISLGGSATWAFLRRGERSLYLCDSSSYLPKTMGTIAGALNMRHVPLPTSDDDLAGLVARCQNDVEILRAAMLELFSIFRQHDLGDFRTTGAGQASAAFRHRFMQPHTLLVHGDADALLAERRSVWSGRAEIWRHGEYTEPLYEYDYTAAYAMIGRDHELPVRLKGEFFPATLEQYDRARKRYAMMCDVTVTTYAPTVPASHDGRVLWPVGTFNTTLWDCEIELARKHGATVTVGRMWAYDRAPLLREWSEWILAALEGEPPGDTQIGLVLVKEWSRSLIGRFGLRYPLLVDLGKMPMSDCTMYPVADEIEQRDTTYVHIGHNLYEQTEKVESPNSTPCVMAYIMALCRIKLWDAMRAAGDGNYFSVDTDGIIVGKTGQASLEAAMARGELPGLRAKRQYSYAHFRAPKNMDLGGVRRITGVPKNAGTIQPGTYRGEVWENLSSALRRRDTRSVVVVQRDFTPSNIDYRRVHNADGSTSAVTLPTA